MNRSDVWDAAYEDGFERGVEAGRLDAVPPETVAMKWCHTHQSEWVGATEPTPYRQCRWSKTQHPLELVSCELEHPVKHWRTV